MRGSPSPKEIVAGILFWRDAYQKCVFNNTFMQDLDVSIQYSMCEFQNENYKHARLTTPKHINRQAA